MLKNDNIMAKIAMHRITEGGEVNKWKAEDSKANFVGIISWPGAFLFTFYWMGEDRDPDWLYHVDAYSSAFDYLHLFANFSLMML